MEFIAELIEFIAELIFEFIIEGLIEAGSNKKVPLPLRILAILVILVIYIAFVTGLLMLGYDAMKQGDTGAAVLVFVVAIGLLLGTIYIIAKGFKKNNRED